MKVLASCSDVSGRIVLEFRPVSGASSITQETADGATLWWNADGSLEVAALLRTSDVTGRALLGDQWSKVLSMADEVTDGEATFEIDVVEPAPRSVSESGSSVPLTVGESPRSVMADESSLDHLLADGVPRSIVGAEGDGDVQGALLALPSLSGVEDLPDPRVARVAWNRATGEMKIQFSVQPGRRTRLWVRVAEGESGELIAMAPPIPADDGSATASTLVPHDGLLGDLYIDATDEPLEVIGSARHRARRRAARLEARASTLRSQGRHREASRFTDESKRIRMSLGDTFAMASEKPSTRRSWWWKAPLLLLALVAAVLVGRSSSSDVRRSDVDGSTPSGTFTTDNIGVLAYRSGVVVFSGNFNFSIAASPLVDEQDELTKLEVEVSDRAEFVYGGGARPLSDVLENECLGSLYSSTGSSGGGTAASMNVVVLASPSLERAVEMLGSETWESTDVVGSFEGMVPMSSSVTEDCVRRQTPDGERLFVVIRQVFEIQTIDLALSSDDRYLVVRSLMPDGSPVLWTSDDVIDIASNG